MASLPRRLDALEKGLDALGPEYDAMMLGELDGFIAGLLVSPVEIEQQEWLDHIWRDVGEDGVTPLDMRPAEALVPNILDHYRRVSLELKAGEDGYMPIYYTNPDDGSTVWEPWAAGFGEAMQLCMESWTAVAVAEDDAVVEAVIGLMAAVSVAHGKTLEELAQTQEEGVDFAQMFEEIDDLLPIWVETLFDWRLIHRPEPVQAPVRVVHIGRNDPCSCGSGKKYKKCCGAHAAG